MLCNFADYIFAKSLYVLLIIRLSTILFIKSFNEFLISVFYVA